MFQYFFLLSLYDYMDTLPVLQGKHRRGCEFVSVKLHADARVGACDLFEFLACEEAVVEAILLEQMHFVDLLLLLSDRGFEGGTDLFFFFLFLDLVIGGLLFLAATHETLPNLFDFLDGVVILVVVGAAHDGVHILLLFQFIQFLSCFFDWSGYVTGGSKVYQQIGLTGETVYT
jgi:hypothetical protein